jgi:hypothetical protein
MDELTVTLPPELVERLRRYDPDKPPAQAILDLVEQALARREKVDRPGLSISDEEWLQQLREHFRRSPLGRYIHAQAAPEVTLEEVLRITAKVKGSLAAEVVAEREDRL